MRQLYVHCTVLAVLLVAAAGRAGIVHELESGAVHEVAPADAECFTSSFLDPDEVDTFPLFCPIRGGASCEDDGEASMALISCVTLRAARGGAHAHYQYWFRVKPEGADPPATPAFVPVHIFAPDVVWDLKLINGALDEEAGSASATFFLRLRSDPQGDLSGRGALVAQTPVLLASHGGISGCLSIPTGVDDVANLVISCELAKDQIQQGRASPSVTAVLEVGRLYSVELAMDLNVEKRVTVKPTTLEVGPRREMNDPDGPLGGTVMKWSRLVFSVGSSSEGLQAQIEDLQAQIDFLRGDFESHSHTYLTSQGVGHNNLEAPTSLPSFPGGATSGGTGADGDGDGLDDPLDACPASPWGVAVDDRGCTTEEFCARQADPHACQSADWRADEGRTPRDCTWRRRSCQER